MKQYIGDKKFYSQFFKIAIPVMLQQLVTLIVTFADNLMVGFFSDQAVSAVYSANQTTFILNICCFGVIGGAGIYLQQFYGSKDKIGMQQCFHFKIYVSILLLIISLPIIYLLGDKLIGFFTTADENKEVIEQLAFDYLKISGISYVFFAISVLYGTSLREIGKTKIPFMASVFALVANVILNSILINGIMIDSNIYFRLGVKGAAIATLVSRVVECLFLVFYSHFKKYGFCSNISNFKINKDLLKTLIIKSIPLSINEVLWSSGMVMLSLAYSQRANVLSALSIASTMSEVFSVVFTGMAAGIGVMVGHELGQGNIEKAKDNSKKLMFLGLIIAVALSLIVMSFSPIIPLMFEKVSIEQKQLATKLLLVYGGLMWCFAIYCSLFITIKSGGKVLETFLMDAGFMWLIPVPVAWILAKCTNLDLVYLYLIVQSFDIVKLILGIYFYKKGNWANDLVEKKIV